MNRRLRQEFDRLAIPHLGLLMRLATRWCGDAAVAEDLVQETYLQAWRSFRRFNPGTNCRAWLCKILLFVHARSDRDASRRPREVELDAAMESRLRFDVATADVLTAEAVRRAFEALPGHYRIAVHLVDVEGFTYREAADGLEVPIGTVMSRLNRARRLMRLALAQHAAAHGMAAGASQEEAT